MLLIVLLQAPSMVGCGEDKAAGSTESGSSSSGGSPQGFLDATLSGSPNGHTKLSVTTLPGAYAEWRDTPNGERLSVHANIPGTSPDFMVGDQSLRIFLQPFDGTREYVFGAVDGGGAAYAELDDTYVYYAGYGESYVDHGSGSITIASRSEARLTGSFSFVAEDKAQAASVTLEGTFDLPLQADGG